MSTKTSKYYKCENTHNHRIDIHIYKELHDGLTYLDLGCDTCYSRVTVPISEHVAELLIGILPKVNTK